LNSIILGLKRHPLRLVLSIVIAFGVLWGLAEPIAHFFPTMKFEGLTRFLLFCFVAILVGILKIYQPRSISIKVNTSDTTLNIYYGDVFKQSGFSAIPVNEYFDSELGDPVSENSVHGMLIKQFFGGYQESFDKMVSADLEETAFTLVERHGGKPNKYPIGTTAKIEANGHDFLLFALSHTNIETFKASADLPMMVQALHGLFERARISTGGEKLNIPLVGSGLSGIGLPATQILQLIVLTIIDETKKQQICKQIDLVLHESKYKEIDLETIGRQWV
jgi:Thoeris protein ThsA, Macro domain